MSTPAKEQPIIEVLLHQAHAAEMQLQIASRRLLTRGMAAEDLPDDSALRALALLGDHERANVLKQLRSGWAALQERGLVTDCLPDDVATPMLRLLAYTLEHLDEIPPLLEALDVDEAPKPDQGMFQCPEKICGVYWGQPLSIRFSAQGIDAIRIQADAVFDLEPVLVRATDGQLSGGCEVLADSGRITFNMSASAGGVFQHILAITTATTLEDML